jgi:hypothetical protein
MSATIVVMGNSVIAHLGRVAPAVVLAMLLSGCGSARTATPAEPAPGVSDAPSASTSEPSEREREAATSPVQPHRDTSGSSFGVDRVHWPATAKGAYKLMNALPQTLSGEPLELTYQRGEEEFGAEANAQYGDRASLSVADEYVTSDTESGKPELFSSGDLLAARFGLVFGCAKRSYRGTIKPLDGGLGPGFGSSRESSKPMWFSCEIEGAEGDDNFTGFAVGWTSAKAAWLVIADDKKKARLVIAGLDAPTK